MKKLVFVVVVAIVVTIVAGLAYANQGIRLVVDGQEIACEVSPRLVEGRTLVPLRTIADIFGAKTEWDAGSRTVYITRAIEPLPQTVTDPLKKKVGDKIAVKGGTLVVNTLGYTADAQGKFAVANITIVAGEDYIRHQSPLSLIKGWVVDRSYTLEGARSSNAPMLFGAGMTATLDIRTDMRSFDVVNALLVYGVDGVVTVTN
ncbi:MAG: copper amine oxidase N-terminal domain-containing protein [Bacillota bacterium]